MKGLKLISVLLLVNICILIVHNLVPHHHHVAIVNHPSSQECPPGDHEHHNEDSGSKHCHAFNDIQFVKYNQSQLPKPVDISSLLSSADPGQVPEPQSDIANTIQPAQNPAVLTAKYSGKLSLRGPPVLS